MAQFSECARGLQKAIIVAWGHVITFHLFAATALFYCAFVEFRIQAC